MGVGGTGRLGSVPFLPPSPLMSLFFISTLKMLQAGAAEKHPGASTPPAAESGAGCSSRFLSGRAFLIGRKGECALSGFGAKPKDRIRQVCS